MGGRVVTAANVPLLFGRHRDNSSCRQRLDCVGLGCSPRIRASAANAEHDVGAEMPADEANIGSAAGLAETEAAPCRWDSIVHP